jgi:hypothetical protein
VSPLPPPADLVSYAASDHFSPAYHGSQWARSSAPKPSSRARDSIPSGRSISPAVTFARFKRNAMTKCYWIFPAVKMLNLRNVILKGHNTER